MVKLFKITDSTKEYWETWESNDFSHIVHWGVLGTEGQSEELKSSSNFNAEEITQAKIDELIQEGFKPLEKEYILLIEFKVNEMGSTEDIEKRHRLEARLNETLGWTGLGYCDGGSIGMVLYLKTIRVFIVNKLIMRITS